MLSRSGSARLYQLCRQLLASLLPRGELFADLLQARAQLLGRLSCLASCSIGLSTFRLSTALGRFRTRCPRRRGCDALTSLGPLPLNLRFGRVGVANGPKLFADHAQLLYEVLCDPGDLPADLACTLSCRVNRSLIHVRGPTR
jgi:hypothetical protein